MVVDGLHRLHDVLTPSPIVSTTASDAFATHITGWSELKATQAPLDGWAARNLDRLVDLEAQAPAAAEGDTLLNFDVRADNTLIARDYVFFVDCPWPPTAPPFLDWISFA